MINCIALTRRDASEWQSRHPVVPGDPISNLYTDQSARYADGDIVAVLAMDGDKVVGKVVVGYADILVRGRFQRCLIPGDLYVLEEYRSKGVGMIILFTLLKQKLPFVAAGVSHAAAQIYDRIPQFKRIDRSPIFMLGGNLPGAVRLARLVAQRRDSGTGTLSRFRVLRLTASKLLASLRLRLYRDAGIEVLAPDAAVQRLDAIASATAFTVQVPWNRAELKDALAGKKMDHRAWVIRDAAQRERLLCMYAWHEEVSLLRTRDVRRVRVAALTEVFPPADDATTARLAVSMAIRGGAEMDATIVFVCAMTGNLQRACEEAGLEQVMEKSVYVCPGGVDQATADALRDPSQWWCRARSERQFREAYLGEAVDHVRDPRELIPGSLAGEAPHDRVAWAPN